MVDTKVISGADSFFLPGCSVGILICHGFNGTPQSVRYVGEKIAAHGYTVYAPRLKGHGTHKNDMEQVTYQDWLQNITEAYLLLKQTCTQIFVMGQSMGGALALHLAAQEDCEGVLTINAALSVPEYEALAQKTTPRFISEGAPDVNDLSVTEITYDQVPIKAVFELIQLMSETKQKLSQVKCPAKIFYSPEDHVVPAHCSNRIYDSVSSSFKELVPLNDSYHVASLDFDKDKIVDHAIAFIQTHSKEAIVAL